MLCINIISLGARFVDLNGDGKIDVVYHRWINSSRIVKAAYINTGSSWRSFPKYIPPYHISADYHRDLGARFVELNGDGLIDFVFHRHLNNKYQKKAAFINTGM